MPHQIGFVDNTSMLAHYAMLETIRDFAFANGWTVLRYDTVPANRELILKGVGYSGEEEIFIGFRTYQNADADYYNLVSAGFTGYVAGNTFNGQPGARWSGIPAHNNRIDYWLTLNPQRIALVMRVGTPVYECAYAGKFLPYARPSQYPYPLAVGGMLNGAAATRFSDTVHSMPWRGNTPGLSIRTNDGWVNPHAHPYQNAALAGSTQLRDSGGEYSLLAVELNDNSGNLWGALDGVYFISGFNNASENTLSVGGRDFVVFQDVARTGFTDYFALEMDA